MAPSRRFKVFEVAARPPVKATVPFAHGLPTLLRAWVGDDEVELSKRTLFYPANPIRQFSRYTEAVIERNDLGERYDVARSNLLMVGLKGSGKTTYLAALWHYLESAEVGDRLVVPQLQPDRDYLNAIRNSWLALRPLERTSMRTKATASLRLQDAKSGAEIEITLPDLSGESISVAVVHAEGAGFLRRFCEEMYRRFPLYSPSRFSAHTRDQGRVAGRGWHGDKSPRDCNSRFGKLDTSAVLDPGAARRCLAIAAWLAR